MSSVFLSHSHADKPFARRLAADLRAAGHSVWIDEAEINIGDSLVEKIRDGIDQVDYVAAVLSEASVASPWVSRELDIASNREMKEKRVVVLPIMVQKVSLPGFLEGKLYGDFTNPERYDDSLKQLLGGLGPATKVVPSDEMELAQLREQLALAQAAVSKHEAAVRVHETLALRGKSDRLVEAIKKANLKHPLHAPINATYAFEVGNIPVTLDYLLWAIAKAERQGSHALETLLTMENRWGAATAMVEAYADMLNAATE